MNDNEMITVDKSEYRNLVESGVKYGILLDILFVNSNLCYNETELNFSESRLNDYLKSMENNRYKNTLNNLKKEKKEDKE